MTDYVEIKISPGLSISFDLVSSLFHLGFLYALHHISTRIPEPNQYDTPGLTPFAAIEAPDNKDAKQNNKNVSKGELRVQQKIQDPLTLLEESHFHSDYYCLWRFWYKLRRVYRAVTTPQYPSYFFTRLTGEQLDALLESREEPSESPSKASKHSKHSKRGKKGKKGKKNENKRRSNTGVATTWFSIAGQSFTNLSKKRWFEHFGGFLSLWMVVCGILSFTLSFAFWVNILLEYTVACVTGYETGSYMGFLAIFFVIHCVTFFCKRAMHATVLLFWNAADSFRVPMVTVWRFSIFFLCLLWTVIYSLDSNVDVTDSIFWQVLLRFMVIQGILWQIIYLGLTLLTTSYSVWKNFFAQYDYKFLLKLRTYTRVFVYARDKIVDQTERLRARNNNNNSKNKSLLLNASDANDANDPAAASPSGGKGAAHRLRDASVSEDTYQPLESHDSDAHMIQNDANGTNGFNALNALNAANAPNALNPQNAMALSLNAPGSTFDRVVRGGQMRASLTEFNEALGSKGNKGNKSGYAEDTASQASDSSDESADFQRRSVMQSLFRLIFVLQGSDSKCFKTFKLIFVPLLFVAMLFCFSFGGDNDLAFVTFIGYILLIYYFIVCLRRGKWNTLYFLYSGRYHESYFNKLQLVARIDQSLLQEASQVSPFAPNSPGSPNSPDAAENGNEAVRVDLDAITPSDENEVKSDPLEDHSLSQGLVSARPASEANVLEPPRTDANDANGLGARLIESGANDVNGVNGMDIVPSGAEDVTALGADQTVGASDASWDNERRRFIRTEPLLFLDFWSVISVDSNDYLGFRVFMKASCELCSIVLIILFVMAFAFFASYVGGNSETSASDYWVSSETIDSPYPICDITDFPGDFNVLDLAYITTTPYYKKREQILTQLDLYFGSNSSRNCTEMARENGWNNTEHEGWDRRKLIIECHNGWDVDKLYVHESKPTFYAIKNVLYNLHLVAIRGTYDMSDVLQDMSLYSESVTVQMFSYVVPLTTVLPTSFIRDFVWYASIAEGMIDPKARQGYDKPVFRFIKANLTHELRKEGQAENEVNNGTILVLGHSLGGGIAEIIGGKLADEGFVNVKTFGLSSPGTIYSSEKFGFSVESLDKTSISVLPRRDPVSSVDMHGGLQEKIECQASSMVYCHSSLRSYCEMFYNCGDKYVNNMTFAHCLCGNATAESHDWDTCAGL